MQHFENHKGNQNRLETSFAQNSEENGEEKMVKKVSQTCRQFLEGTCAYKKKHEWKECPSNIWGINKGNFPTTRVN